MKIILFLKLFLKKMLLKELLQNLGKYLTNTCSQFIFSRFFQIFSKKRTHSDVYFNINRKYIGVEFYFLLFALKRNS